MTPEQGLIDLEATYKRELAMGWAFIRKLALFVGEWGPGYIYQVADHLNRSPKTLQNYISIARAPISHYAESLGLSRADAGAVVGLPEEEAKALLLQAAEEGLADDWLRFKAREYKLPPTGKEGNGMDERTYHAQVRPVETLTAIDDGGTQHRANGADPYHGVTVPVFCDGCQLPADICRCDDVPFALPPDPIDGADNDTPFDVAERVVKVWGVPFAKEVAGHIERWGEWQ